MSLLDDNTKLTNKFYFPFIMTQSPIKPLISTKQYVEYGNAYRNLDKCKYLYIIGYSLNENDNHITAIIRDFIFKEVKK